MKYYGFEVVTRSHDSVQISIFFSHHILYAIVLSFALHKQCIIQKLKTTRYIFFQILFAVVQLKCLKVYAESNKKNIVSSL